MNISFNKLIIDRTAYNDPLTHRLKQRLPDAAIEVVPDITPFLHPQQTRNRSLVITHQRGKFIKDFPEAPGTPPCSERYITTLLNCPFSCSDCYLQSYLDHRQIIVFTNTERMREELKTALTNNPPSRITTGEMGDSLAIDHLTGTTADLLPLFKDTETLLEVRTKSSNIDHLLRHSGKGSSLPSTIENSDRLLVTWTLSPPNAIKKEEHGAARLEDRLDAISKISGSGIKVAIRFDPIIPFYFTQVEYEKIVKSLKRVAKNRIYRFELGILRFPPGLWENVRSEYPKSAIMQGEYHRDSEGKIRFYRPTRIKIYRELHRILSNHFTGVPVELSMEHNSVWQDAGIPLPS
jgi:spore photoproduct lyase